MKPEPQNDYKGGSIQSPQEAQTGTEAEPSSPSGDLKSRRSFFTSVASVASITVVSRVLGLVREQVRAHYLGTSIYSDAFAFAFALPNLFRRFTAEGAMSTAFIPVFSQLKESEGEAPSEKEKKWQYAAVIFNILTLFTVLLTLSGIFCSPLLSLLASGGEEGALSQEALQVTIELTQYMFVYIVFISLAALMQSILNSFGHFARPALTPVLFNLSFILAAFLFASSFSNPAYAFALGVVTGGVVQFLFLVPPVLRLGFRFMAKVDFKNSAVRKTLSLMVPSLIGGGVYQINIFASSLIALSLGEGALSSLSYSNRLMELVLGVFIVSLATVLLPKFSGSAGRKDFDEMRGDYLFSMKIVTLITLPAMVGLYLLREPVLNFLFVFEGGSFDARSLEITAYAMQFHILGLYLIAVTRISQPLLFALQDMKVPMYAGVAAMVVNIALCFALSPFMFNGGIALANTLSIFVQVSVLLWGVRKISAGKTLLPGYALFCLKALGSALLMGLFVHEMVVQTAMTESTGKLDLAFLLFAAIGGGGIVFIVGCFFFRITEISHLLKRIAFKRGG